MEATNTVVLKPEWVEAALANGIPIEGIADEVRDLVKRAHGFSPRKNAATVALNLGLHRRLKRVARAREIKAYNALAEAVTEWLERQERDLL